MESTIHVEETQPAVMFASGVSRGKTPHRQASTAEAAQQKPAASASPRKAAYSCGDCGKTLLLSTGDAVVCRFCGYRILFKLRAHGTAVKVCASAT